MISSHENLSLSVRHGAHDLSHPCPAAHAHPQAHPQPLPALVSLLCSLCHALGDDLSRYHARHAVARCGRGGHGRRHRVLLVWAGAFARVAPLLRHGVRPRIFPRMSRE